VTSGGSQTLRPVWRAQSPPHLHSNACAMRVPGEDGFSSLRGAVSSRRPGIAATCCACGEVPAARPLSVWSGSETPCNGGRATRAFQGSVNDGGGENSGVRSILRAARTIRQIGHGTRSVKWIDIPGIFQANDPECHACVRVCAAAATLGAAAAPFEGAGWRSQATVGSAWPDGGGQASSPGSATRRSASSPVSGRGQCLGSSGTVIGPELAAPATASQR